MRVFIALVMCLFVLSLGAATSFAATRGDFTGDGAVDVADVRALIANLGKSVASHNLVGDNGIDLFDYNALLSLFASSQTNTVLVYPVTTPSSFYSGSIAVGGSTAPLQFRTIRSNDFGYESRTKFKTHFTRLATTGTASIKLTTPTPAAWAMLYAASSEIPTTITGNTIAFTLPAGPGVYVLKTNISTEADQVEALTFWVDDLNSVVRTPPSGSVQIRPGDDLQAAINAAGPNTTIFIHPGQYQYKTLQIANKDGLRIVLHPSAVLLQQAQTCTNSTPCVDFISILNSHNITISGPGEIQAPPRLSKTVMWVKDSTNITLRDFFLYKIHHEDGGQINIARSNNVLLEDVRVIGQNGGVEPDASANVRFNRMYIEGQDDGVAVKSRTREANGIYTTNSIVRSAASALKIGESTVLYPITNIYFENNTVLDTDRALIVVPRGRDGDIGSIGSVLYKNIKVRFVQFNKFGLTMEVQKSESDAGDTGNPFSSATSIVFENIDADFVEPVYLETKVTIKNSVFQMHEPISVFEGTICPTISNLQVRWHNGTGKNGRCSW